MGLLFHYFRSWKHGDQRKAWSSRQKAKSPYTLGTARNQQLTANFKASDNGCGMCHCLDLELGRMNTEYLLFGNQTFFFSKRVYLEHSKKLTAFETIWKKSVPAVRQLCSAPTFRCWPFLSCSFPFFLVVEHSSMHELWITSEINVNVTVLSNSPPETWSKCMKLNRNLSSNAIVLSVHPIPPSLWFLHAGHISNRESLCPSPCKIVAHVFQRQKNSSP